MMKDLEDRVHTALSTIVSAAPAPRDMPDIGEFEDDTDGTGRRKRVASFAACLIVVGALGAAAVLVASLDGLPVGPTTSTPVAASAHAPGPDQERHPVGREWLPLLPFSLTSSQNEQLYELWQSRIAECVSNRGFDYVEAIYYDSDEVVNPLDLAAVQRYGYHEPSFIAQTTTDDPNLDQIENDPEFADATSDCATAALNQTWGPAVDTKGYFAQNDALRSSFSSAIDGFDRTPGFTALAANWSRCMAEQGYSYTSPNDALLRYSDANSITDVEIATRIADAQCDRATGLTTTRSRWEAQQRDAWLAANQPAVDAAIAARDTFIEAAL